ncbi:MAG: Sua5/YciO/YrdC/YwlC family protein [Proteobacteria bacterium]|nr:Sua5/YciO/YrdC/YwlC family protein [Pseudomonadota bacterium]
MSLSKIRSNHAPIARLQKKIRATLKNGGLIAYPTSSCFGLGCDPSNHRALKKLLALKKRPHHKGFIIIGHNFNQLKKYIRPLNTQELEPALKSWPGPHTWLMPASKKTIPLLHGNHHTLAVRVDGHSPTRFLLTLINQPLVSTSANLSGKRAYKQTRDCLRQFGKNVLVIPGRTGKSKTPSSIHDLASGRKIR